MSNNNIPTFLGGSVELIEGCMFTEDELEDLSQIHPMIISDAFARVNGLNLGSTVSLYDFICPMDGS